MARRLEPDALKGLPAAVTHGYQLTLGRKPDPIELRNATEFVKQQTASYNAENKSTAAELALADFCQVLFGLNEFLYIE